VPDIDISSVSDSVIVAESTSVNYDLDCSRSDLIFVSESFSVVGPVSVYSSNNSVHVSDVPFVEVALQEFPNQLTDVPDLDRIYLVEIKVGREIELEVWTEASGAYWCSFNSAEFGEVIRLKEKDTSYSKAADVAACQASEPSYYHDFSNKKLYIHMPGGVIPSGLDGNGVPDFCIIAYFWICITNRQPEEARVIYAPQGLTNEVYYLPYLDSDKMPAISQSVGQYYTADVTTQFGTMAFVNDGWWYKALENMLWHNAEMYIKVGTKGDIYAAFSTILVGTVRNPKVSDEEASLDVSDSRTNTLAEIPVTFYPVINDDGTVTPDYPVGKYIWTEPSASGRPIPIPFGYCRGIIPVCLDPAEYIFKISDYEIEDITAVYENEVKLYPPVLAEGEDPAQYLPATGPEYTKDLVNGEFALLQDFGDHVITCDVKGVKCGPQNPPEYSENFADAALFILINLNKLSTDDILASSFSMLRDERQQKIGIYVDSLTDSLEVLRMFQTSVVFQLFPDLAGRWTAEVYTTSTDGALPVRKEDISKLGIEYDTEGVFWQVQVKYRKDPATGEFLTVSASDDKVKYRYKESKVLEVQTALYDTAEATALAQFYLMLVKIPPKSIRGDIGIEGFGRSPSAKVLISKDIIDGEGNKITLLSDAVYRIFEFSKDLGPAKTNIVGLDDAISLGDLHIDSAEYHDHLDSYVDTDAVQTDHLDWPHSDSPHADVLHSDVYDDIYNDYYQGWPCILKHTDGMIHADGGGHWDYADNPGFGGHDPLGPTWYSDYSDIHLDVHLDVAVTESGQLPIYMWHADDHADIAHADHTDSTYGDTPHGDSPYQDRHEQSYTDNPHGDAHY
jgi:hypothetical protein